MSLTNVNVGLQKDADTMALFKSIREFDQALGILGEGVYNQADAIVDNTGNFPLTGVSSPQIANGPLGEAGWNQATPQFARSFMSSAAGHCSGGFIDQAFNDACRDVGGFTQQFMFKFEWDNTATRGIFGANNDPNAGAVNDWLCRVLITSAGFINIFWESNDTNFGLTGTSPVQPGKWQVATVTWLPAATGYDVAIYLHTLDSPGVVTGGLDVFSADLGVLPLSTSGVGDSILQYGRSEKSGPTNFIGDIAFGRFFKGILTPTQIDAQAEELLTTGTLTASDASDLFRHEFNEPPDWIDEGIYGFHGQDGKIVDFDSLELKHIDLLGSGGRARRNANSVAIIYGLSQARTVRADIGGADRLNDLFNEIINNPPEWTMQWWGIYNGSSDQALAQWSASSESLPTNFLLQMILTSAGSLVNFSERGSGGTNNTVVGLVGSWDSGNLEITEQPMLVTIRSDDDGGGAQRIRLSINDDIDVLSFTMSNTPQGGNAALGLQWAWPLGGLLQEFKLSKVAIPDQQIIDDAARSLDREGAAAPVDVVAPTITNFSPPQNTEIDPDQTISFDITDDSGLFAGIVVFVSFPDATVEVIHDGDGFRGNYRGSPNVRTSIANGFRYVVRRIGDWPGSPTIEFLPIDQGGNLGVIA